MASAAHPVSSFSFGSASARFVWSGLLPGERGAAIELPDFDKLNIEVIGQFAGARLGLEASSDGRKFDFLSVPMRKPGKEAVNARPAFVRPVVIGGNRETLLQCTVTAARA